MMNQNELKQEIVDLVIAAAGGDLTGKDLDDANGDLLKVGYSSFAFTNLLVLLEENYHISLTQPEGEQWPVTVDGITELVAQKIQHLTGSSS